MKSKLIALFTVLFFVSELSMAQDLPVPSPRIEATQRVGLTDITINYSRPSAKEREIFGSLVPFDKLWRTGANKNTTIQFSDQVLFGGEEVDAGIYSLFSIPNEDGSWTVILNEDTSQYGTSSYDKKKDVVRITAQTAEGVFSESMLLFLDELRNESAKLVLSWNGMGFSVPITVFTHEKAVANIKAAIATANDDDYRVYQRSAGYYLETETDLKQALKWANKSLEIKDYWYTRWIKAQIQAKLFQFDDARAEAEKAISMGQEQYKKQNRDFTYEEGIREEMEEWKPNLQAVPLEPKSVDKKKR